MQALLPHFTDRKLRQGPFFYELSDLHQNSIFVDSESHMKCLVDLEWACMFGTCSVLHIGWLACLWTFWRARTSVLSQKRKTNFWRYLKKKRSHFHLMVWLFISDKLHEKKKVGRLETSGTFMPWKAPRASTIFFLATYNPDMRHSTVKVWIWWLLLSAFFGSSAFLFQLKTMVWRSTGR